MLSPQSLRSAARVLALAASLGGAARAEDPPVKPCTPSTATPSTAEVKRVVTSTGGRVALRDTIAIEMSDHTLVEEAACKGKNIVLFLDDRPLKDVVAYPPTDSRGNVLRFPLQRTEASRDVWAYVLGRPSSLAARDTKVSVGVEDQHAIPSKASVKLEVIPRGWFGFWVFVLIVLVIGFLTLALQTDILRDAGPDPGEGKRKPYSLARTQASWWFFLVLAAYLFIGMVTGDFSSSITGTVLVLMGISAGTVVGSAFVDASKATPDANQREVAAKQSLQADVDRLEGEVAGAAGQLKLDAKNVEAARALATKSEGLAARESQLRKLNNENEHFIRDILSDANGVNFHRFQMVAWTAVLGIIFVGHVYKELAMPTFSETLLSLMGISAGTYIGLKIPEDTVPKTGG